MAQEEAQSVNKDEVYKFSINRIKKKINDFIINEYNTLFTGQKNTGGEATVPVDYLNVTVTENDFFNHPRLLDKVKAELMYSEDPSKTPQDLLKECLIELESKGFINSTGDTVRHYQLQIRDQRKKLKSFV